jgi:hypothetical protein
MLDVESKPLRRRRPRRGARWLARVAVDNAGGAAYGTVMVGVLLAAEDSHREGYPETIGAASVVLALYWLLSLYTHTLGIRLRTKGRLSLRLLWRSCAHELAIVEGVAGATVTSGVTVALWVTVVSLVTLEVAAAWRARTRPLEAWLQAALGAVMGLAIIALKLILH